MADVVVYTKSLCSSCWRAKRLLKKKGVGFEEIDVGRDPDRLEEMARRSSGRVTAPQIFIDGEHVGGSDDLAALEARGELDKLLRGAGEA